LAQVVPTRVTCCWGVEQGPPDWPRLPLMSDGGSDDGEAAEFFEGGGEGGGEEGGVSDGGSSGKACGTLLCFVVGLVLMALCPYGIWHNEGDYVKIQQALGDALQKAKEPCTFGPSGDCRDCNLADVKDGDLVFVACKLQNMKTLQDWAQDFSIPELRPLVKSMAPAAVYEWNVSMFQYFENPVKTKTVLMQTSGTESGVTCGAASGLHEDNDYGASQRIQRCCQAKSSVGNQHFLNTYVGDHKECQLPYRSTTGSGQAALAPSASGSRRLADEAGLAMEKDAPTPGTQEGAREEVTEEEEDKESVQELMGFREGGDEEEADDRAETKARRLSGGRRRGSDTRRRRSTKFHCGFKCFSWTKDFAETAKPDPAAWQEVPATLFPEVGYLQGAPAMNLPQLPLGQKWSNVKNDPTGVNVGGFTLASFDPEVSSDRLFDNYTQASLLPIQAGSRTLDKMSMGIPTVRGPMSIGKYTRTSTWGPENSEARAEANCIYSRSGSTQGPQVGDLRVCFTASATAQLTLLAEVRTVNGVHTLVASQTHLRPQAQLGNLLNGYMLVKDRIVSKADLAEDVENMNNTKLYILRFLLPLLLGCAFYCVCAMPLLALIDAFGDGLDWIPCIGGCLEDIVDFIETLMSCMLMCVSCACGLTLALFVMGIAWLRFRPLIGGTMLAVAALIIVGIVALRIQQRGAKKVRGKRKEKNPELLENE